MKSHGYGHNYKFITHGRSYEYMVEEYPSVAGEICILFLDSSWFIVIHQKKKK